MCTRVKSKADRVDGDWQVNCADSDDAEHNGGRYPRASEGEHRFGAEWPVDDGETLEREEHKRKARQLLREDEQTEACLTHDVLLDKPVQVDPAPRNVRNTVGDETK